jgi:hypothetical protein
MAEARGWQPEVGQSLHALPRQPADLTPPPERAAHQYQPTWRWNALIARLLVGTAKSLSKPFIIV